MTFPMPFFAPGSSLPSTVYVTGDRTATITVTKEASIQGTASSLVNGALASATFFNNSNDVAGIYFRFQFSASQLITEAKWYQDAANSHGTWKWQGGPDGSSWTDIGASFTLGGSTIQTQTTLNGNTNGYLWYQLIGVTGARSAAPNHQEIEFKQAAYP
jgi:hypothetical protein